MIDVDKLDFEFEISRYISHLEIFKVCREGFFNACLDCRDFGFKLYEVFDVKAQASRPYFMKALSGKKYFFINKEEKKKDIFSFVVDGFIMFIGIEEGKFVFFNKLDLLLIKIDKEDVKQWIDLNFIKLNLTAFSKILKKSFLEDLAKISEEDIDTYSLE